MKCKERNCSKFVNCSKPINNSQLPTTSFSGSFLPHLQHSPINYVIDISVRLSMFNLYQWADWLKTDVIAIALNNSKNIFL